MYNGKKILSIIPARGGSKGIKNKNIIPIMGIPLIHYSISEAKKSKYIDTIIVSSDSEKILQTSQIDGIQTMKRPKNLSGDNAKISDTILFTINSLKEKHDFVILLQPTSPMRSVKTIDLAIEKFINNELKFSSLMPLCAISAKIGTIENGLYIPHHYGEHQRQHLGKLYQECGTIFIYKTHNIEQRNPIGKKIFPFIVKNYEETIDIDTIEDVKIIESILQYNKNHE